MAQTPKVAPLTPADLEKLQEKRKRKYKAVKQLTTPLWSMSHTPTLLIRAEGEPHEADFTLAIPGKPDSKPLVLGCCNLDTDEKGLLVLNALMSSALARAGGLINGRIFEFKANGKKEGKDYLDVKVTEMDESDE